MVYRYIYRMLYRKEKNPKNLQSFKSYLLTDNTDKS